MKTTKKEAGLHTNFDTGRFYCTSGKHSLIPVL